MFVLKQKIDKNKNRLLEFYARTGRWMASDYVANLKDKIYVIPTICFYFNRSEFCVAFKWLNILCLVKYTDFTKFRIY